MRKSKRTFKLLISELEKTGIASNACSKLSIARSTYYRWYKEDIDFRMAADEAIESGRANMVDFAESKLVQNISEGNQRAVEYYLRSNDSRYRTYHGRELQEYKDNLDNRNRKDFGALDTIPRMLLELIPSEKLEQIIIANMNKHPQAADMSLEALERELTMRYVNSLLLRANK
jgi:hypothetical protein